MTTESANGPQDFPDEIVAWVTANPEHIQNWMNDPDFRRQLLSDPESYGLTGSAGDWVKERVQNKGIDRLVGDQPGHIVAM